MSRLLLVLALTHLVAGSESPPIKPFEGPKPIVTLIGGNPWASVMGGETPDVAVYEDGTAIFTRVSGGKATWRYKRLNRVELSEFKSHLKPILAPREIKRFYNLTPWITDGPTTDLYIKDGERELTVHIYGSERSSGPSAWWLEFRPHEKPDVLPPELVQLHHHLSTLDFRNSAKWKPRFLEVMIWNYEYAPMDSIHWPSKWPGLNSNRTFKWDDSSMESYSIFLDGDQLKSLEKFVSKRKELGAVEIGGKKWAISYRAVFPSEPIWREAMRRGE